MIDVKQAVQLAKAGAADLLDQSSSRLEEIERRTYNDRDVWSITLGLPRGPREISLMAPIARLSAGPLEYKRFLIDVETGELVAMQLREVASQ